MPREVHTFNNPTLKVADDQASLATGLSVECQVMQAKVLATAQYNTIPSTGCEGATQSPGATAYSLQIEWLQDWKAGAAASLSNFAWEHDGEQIAFELIPDAADTTTKMTGDVYCTAGSFGGVFGDGSAGTSDQQTWPCVSRPTLVIPAATGTQTTAETPAPLAA